MSRKRIPLNQNGCTANFRIGVPFEQNLQIPSIEEQKKIIKEVESIEIVRTKNKVVVERLQDKIAEIFKRTVF